MRRIMALIFATLLSMPFAASPSMAMQVINFTDGYALPNYPPWTTDNAGNVDTSGTPNEIVLTEPVSLTIPSLGPGTFEFDYSVSGFSEGARLEIFAGSGLLFDVSIEFSGPGITTVVPGKGFINSSCGAGTGICSGTYSVAVDTGDIIGWKAVDIETGGPAQWTISNFTAPALVPIPASVLLLLSGLVAFLGIARRGSRVVGP